MDVNKIKRFIPILTWLPHYNKKNIRFDLIAGIAVAGLAIPESMGIAGIAGVAPQFGLYSIFIALFLYAILGSGRRSVVSTPTSMAIITAAAIASLAITQNILVAVVTITLITGLILLLMAIFRLGLLANFISYPVMKGFLFGLSLTIIISQVPKLFGVERGTGDFFEQLWHIITELNQTNLLVLTVSIIAIIIMLLLEAKVKKIPSVLLLLIFGLVASYLLDWGAKGVQLVGYIPSGLPAFVIPQIDPAFVYSIIPVCIGIAFVCFSETVSIGNEIAEKHDDDEVDPNQELVAVAGMNLGASLTQGIGSGVAMSDSHVGDNSGSKSQMTLIVAGIAVVITLLFLTSVFYYLPEFVLAIIIIFAVKEALKFRLMASYYRTQRKDFLFAMVALFGVLIFDVLAGLLLAIIFALGSVVWKVSNEKGSLRGRMPDGRFEDVSMDPNAKEIEGVKILRINFSLFYANAPVIKARLINIIKEEPRPRLLIIDMDAHTHKLDISSGKALEKVVKEAKGRGVRVVFTGVHTLPMKDMEKQGLVELIGKENFKYTIEDALQGA